MEASELMITEALPFSSEPTQQEENVFITANTISSNLEDIRQNHIIPVFARDNEPAISQSDFIEVMHETVADVYQGEHILKPLIRLSHPIKCRIPEARNKPAGELQEWERTIFYERMMFVIELPSIQDTIDGSSLSLTVGGVKAYNLDNLSGKKGSDEHFKVFVGFKNKVCTNLSVSTDGLMNDLKVRNIGQLKACIYSLLQSYNANFHLFHLKQLSGYSLSENQFATLIGRSRMYQYLPTSLKKEISPLLFGEAQISNVCREYFRDRSFSRDSNGNINLWKLYNLFTGANKSTYIDQFLERSVNAFGFIDQLRMAFEGKQSSWYLS